jgi:hypothetical protein
MSFEDEMVLQFGIQDIEFFDVKEFAKFCARFREIAPETFVSIFIF